MTPDETYFQLRRHITTNDLAALSKALDHMQADRQKVLTHVPKSGTPLLAIAVTKRNPDPKIIHALLEAGADPNQAFQDGLGMWNTPFSNSLQAGSLAINKAMLDYGADVKQPTLGGYDAALHLVHGRRLRHDPDLAELVQCLLDHGADFNSKSSYGERPIIRIAQSGRFDILKTLLENGIDDSCLGFSPLHWVAVLGTPEELDKLLLSKPDLNAPDSCILPPVYYAALGGNLHKVRSLVEAGADLPLKLKSQFGMVIADNSTFGAALESQNQELIQYMIDLGANESPNPTLDAEYLAFAASQEATESVKLLLESGAAVATTKPMASAPISNVTNPEIAKLMIDAGANPADLDREAKQDLLGLGMTDYNEPFETTSLQYRQQRSPQFGKTSPELINKPFWNEMVRRGNNAYCARRFFQDEDFSCGGEDPVWCADRFGQSLNFLPDGRIIRIAGEHEDGYDPDFCIYNDVIVHQPDGSFEIWGYSREDFAPTDFHTATLIGDQIYIIGNLGYPQDRKPGTTPVYVLDTNTYAIKKVETTGQNPGWINRHNAKLISPHEIQISNGNIWGQENERSSKLKNLGKAIASLATRGISEMVADFMKQHQPDLYTLDVNTLTWTKVEQKDS